MGHSPKTCQEPEFYLFTEAGRHLYVGRSNNLRGRLGRHCRPGATYWQAAFAFQLAREVTGRTKATVSRRSRQPRWLDVRPGLCRSIRGCQMEYRYVEETDQNRQALLEIYCAVVLGTPYNDFASTRPRP